MLVYILLRGFDGPFVARLKAMTKTSLKLHKLGNGQLLFGLIAQQPVPVNYLVKRPYTGFDRHFAYLRQKLR